jgi:hypothetical protein
MGETISDAPGKGFRICLAVYFQLSQQGQLIGPDPQKFEKCRYVFGRARKCKAPELFCIEVFGFAGAVRHPVKGIVMEDDRGAVPRRADIEFDAQPGRSGSPEGFQ